jgi:hypothetical protein
VRRRARGSRRRRAKTCRSARGGSSNLLPDVWTSADPLPLQMQDRCVCKWNMFLDIPGCAHSRSESALPSTRSKRGRLTSPLASPHVSDTILFHDEEKNCICIHCISISYTNGQVSFMRPSLKIECCLDELREILGSSLFGSRSGTGDHTVLVMGFADASASGASSASRRRI